MKETFGVVKLSLLLLADIFTKFAHFELFERQSDTERDREGGGWRRKKRERGSGREGEGREGEKGSEGEDRNRGKRESGRIFHLLFISQLPTTPGPGPSQYQDPGAPLGFPVWVAGS